LDLKALVQNLFKPRRERSRGSENRREKKEPPQKIPEATTTAKPDAINHPETSPRTPRRLPGEKKKELTSSGSLRHREKNVAPSLLGP
jgi:hypothetical protein